MNQNALQQVRQIVEQMENVGADADMHAIASREILFMQLLVHLRKAASPKGPPTTTRGSTI